MNTMLRIALLPVAFLLCLAAAAQSTQTRQSFPIRYFNKVFKDTSHKEEDQLLVYPVVAYSPETSVELGASILYVSYAQKDTTNRLSEINGSVFYTINNQFGALFDHALYSDKNTWFLLGKLKFQSFPLSYYGIGAETPGQKLARVDALQFQVKERLLHKINGNFYGGIETDLQHLGNVDFVDHAPGLAYEKPRGHAGSTNLGLGLGLLYDNRNNVLNVRKGFFSEIAFLHYSPIVSRYEFTSVFTDVRWFHPVRKRNVLAAHAIGQFSFGHPPFNQLALMGGESIMRGYYLGRFRDKNLVATQLEYRMLPFFFARRWGASIFCGTGAVFNHINAIQPGHVVFAGGGGVRFQLFPKKDVWIRVDMAFTNEGNGLYIFVGEAF